MRRWHFSSVQNAPNLQMQKGYRLLCEGEHDEEWWLDRYRYNPEGGMGCGILHMYRKGRMIGMVADLPQYIVEKLREAHP